MTGDPARAPYVDPSAPQLLARVPAPRRALFLDRDGVINVDHGYVHRPDQTDWMPGIFDLVRDAVASGFLPIVITNQAGIARGYYTEAQFVAYAEWMHDRFRERGTPLLATYYCPHHPEAGQGDYRQACACRKPEPGMLLRAIDDWAIDAQRSVMIGDKASDCEAAHRAGVGRALLTGPAGTSPLPFAAVGAR